MVIKTTTPRRRGYDASGGDPVNKKDITSFRGPVGRSTEANHEVDSTNRYADTYCWCNSRGDSEQRGMDTTDSKTSGHYEEQKWSGGMNQENPRGDQFSGCSGCRVSSTKKGEVGTTQGASDVCKYNGCRSCSGNDGNQKELAVGGAKYQESFGYDAHWQAQYTQAYAGNATESAWGKKTINAEGGVGIGVNKGESRKVYMRMEPDGTFHLQVTPHGQEGGNAVVKIDPDGTISVSSLTTITMKASQGMTIQTDTLTINADVKITGDLNQVGGGHIGAIARACD